MTKMIAVTDEVYSILSKFKMPGESFTVLFKRKFNADKKNDLTQFVGCLSNADADIFEETVRESRKSKWRDITF